jgi:Transposase
MFCGIDWSEQHHDVAIVDNTGALVAKRRISDDPHGWRQLLQLLAEAGDNAEQPMPVAIETPQGLLVSCLRGSGRPVYAMCSWAGLTPLHRESESDWQASSIDLPDDGGPTSIHGGRSASGAATHYNSAADEQRMMPRPRRCRSNRGPWAD